jgi:hypothetical protein
LKIVAILLKAAETLYTKGAGGRLLHLWNRRAFERAYRRKMPSMSQNWLSSMILPTCSGCGFEVVLRVAAIDAQAPPRHWTVLIRLWHRFPGFRFCLCNCVVASSWAEKHGRDNLVLILIPCRNSGQYRSGRPNLRPTLRSYSWRVTAMMARMRNVCV